MSLLQYGGHHEKWIFITIAWQEYVLEWFEIIAIGTKMIFIGFSSIYLFISKLKKYNKP